MNPVLTIAPEFEAKCPPLTDDYYSSSPRGQNDLLETNHKTRKQIAAETGTSESYALHKSIDRSENP